MKPRELTPEELAVLYEVLNRAVATGSKSTLTKGGILKWIEDQVEVPDEPSN